VEADVVLQLALQGTGTGVWHYNVDECLTDADPPWSKELAQAIRDTDDRETAQRNGALIGSGAVDAITSAATWRSLAA
jgi:hypothetical protein